MAIDALNCGAHKGAQMSGNHQVIDNMEGEDVKAFRSRIAFTCLVFLQAVLAFNCGQSSPSTFDSPRHEQYFRINFPGKIRRVHRGYGAIHGHVSGTTQTGVTWAIISPSTKWGLDRFNGSYKAPAAALPSPVTIVAKSDANPSKSHMAAVWVLAPGKVSTTNHPMVADYSMTTPDGPMLRSNSARTLLRPGHVDAGRRLRRRAGEYSGGRHEGLQHLPHAGGGQRCQVGAQFMDSDHTFQTQGPASNPIPP